MISKNARNALAAMRVARLAPAQDLATARQAWEDASSRDPLPAGTVVQSMMVGGVPIERVRCGSGSSGGVFVLLHGGGYTSGSPRTHRKLAAWIARESGMDVVVPDYRLAPEHPFPAALDDALAVWRAVTGDPTVTHATLGGDSAGGGLGLAMMLAARNMGLPMPAACVLMSPWTDLRGCAASHTLQLDVDAVVTPAGLQQAATSYAGGADLGQPLISPVLADLTGLPPLLIDVGGDEILLDDAASIAAHAMAANVEVQFRVWPGLWHVWHLHAGTVPEADKALARIGEFLRSPRDTAAMG
jgi:epsilon-lactone hydrolase